MDMLGFLLSGSYFIIVLLQIICVVHVIRQRRGYYWIFLIMFFPVVGSIVYFIIEVLPGLRSGRFIKSLGKTKKASRGAIRRLKETLQFSDTVENKQNLADAHLSRGEYAEACGIYSDCLSGLYENDAVLIHKLAESFYGARNYEEAIKLLLQLKELKYRDYKVDREYLLALSYKHTEQKDKAIEILASIVGLYPGEEARYELGILYLESTRTDDAVRAFEEVIQNRKLYRKAAIGRQTKWVSLSRKRLKEIKANNVV